MSLKRIYFIK